MSFDLLKYIARVNELVEGYMDAHMPAKNAFPPVIHESMRYSLFAGGKRVRPLLVIASAEACGGKAEQVLPIAAALEMIHTFSLVHDDLPAMDDDSLRRGKPTNHVVYGEATAILAGDGLIAQAFSVLTQLNGKINADCILPIINDIALATGSVGMVGGQVLDMQAEGKELTLDALKKLHSLKTGQLITVSVTSGAKAITADTKRLQMLEQYGQAIGLAFQIADDILDIEGGEEIGKDIGSDAENNKMTYPKLLGLDGAKKEAKRVVDEALSCLAGFGEEAEPLRALARYIIERKK
ncbi:polyprenyl synthetase family protein [bacterium]|nr:polyprenyl synthetase family protein [bacterium]